MAKFITNIVINLVTPKVPPMLKLWFNKPDSDVSLVNIYVRCNWHNKIIINIVMTLVAPEVDAKLEHLINKHASYVS